MQKYSIYLIGGKVIKVKGNRHFQDNKTLTIYMNGEFVARFYNDSIEKYTIE